ncbi:MAG: heparan-alpha-glucosaminide N-acetyltransferase domain-containing protein [Promethearchaeota archaeon]
MTQKRFKTIDIFRGLAMFFMILGHLMDWWIQPESRWLWYFLIFIGSWVGAAGFLFVSGISGIISYRRGVLMAEKSDLYSLEMVKNGFIFRALLIVLIGLIFNTCIAIALMNPFYIWTWFVLLTIGISLLLTVPLLNTSKMTRICISGISWILNHILFSILKIYAGQLNFFGILYHILYHSPDQDVILGFFPFLLYGTVIGDILFEVTNPKNPIEKKNEIKKKLLIPSLVIGSILIIFGLWFWHPNYDVKVLIHPTNVYWAIFSCGVQLVIFSIGIYLEESIKTEKNYRFLFYFSYYSLTIYLVHYLLFFVPLHQQLNAITFWLFFLPIYFIMGLILRMLYKKYQGKVALKTLIGIISMMMSLEIEKQKRKLSKTSIKFLRKMYFGNISKF